MYNGWQTYSIVFISAFIALLFPALLKLLSLWMQESKEGAPVDSMPVPPRKNPRELSVLKLNSQFFLALSVALVLMTLSLILIPCVAYFGSIQLQDLKAQLRVSACLVGFALLIFLSLLYSFKKGSLNWLNLKRRLEKNDE